jgi:lysyl-tRNA synthetase class 1
MKGKSLFWADQLAREITEREKRLDRGIKVIRTESGLGASGIPHVGSLGDVLRQYAVMLGIRDLGLRSETIAYSDDMDGLRKVPLGFPPGLRKYIGMPVSHIPDPFGCHKSYGEHMSSLLIEAIERVGMHVNFNSAHKNYKSGVFDKQIERILLGSQRVGKIIKEMSGQEKYVQVYPYLPICERCGRIYTTRVYEIDPEGRKVLYKCDQEFAGNDSKGRRIAVRGCGYTGEARYRGGNGKLAWKVEFAARWDALKISFEAVGKDILDSVKINDRVCRDVLGFEPPLHAVYELFLEKGGKKISKSIGNVFAPQDWLRYGSPESLRLLMFKRFRGTRELGPGDIPKYMDEVDLLERIYFGDKKVSGERELSHLKRLFEYVHYLTPPKSPLLFKVPYNTLVNLVKVLPIKEKVNAIKEILVNTGHIRQRPSERDMDDLNQRIGYTSSWTEAMGEGIERPRIILKKNEREALHEVSRMLKKPVKPGDMQEQLFEISRRFGIEVPRFFRIFYSQVLGIDRGPRASNLIEILGRERVSRILKSV